MANREFQVDKNGSVWLLVTFEKKRHIERIEPLEVSNSVEAMEAAETILAGMSDTKKRNIAEMYIMHASIEDDGSIDEYRAETYDIIR